MIAKEWRDARWKFAVAALVVTVAVLATPTLTPYQEIKKVAEQTTGYRVTQATVSEEAVGNDPGVAQARTEHPIPKETRAERNPANIAVKEMWIFYGGGGFAVLIPLAALLGAPLISGEVSGSTISLLLSRPVSRSRVLLTKYCVCAGVLLAAAVLGGALVVALAAARGYPLDDLSAVGIMLSAILGWLGSLFVLGVALLVSVLLRSVIASLSATALIVVLAFIFPGPFINYSLWTEYHRIGISEQTVQKLLLPQYWYSEGLYAGQSLVPGYFLVSLVAAALPLILALWLFRRLAY